MSQRKIESHSGLVSKAVYLRALGRAQELLSSRSATEDILRMALNKPVELRADTDRRKYAVAAGLVQLCRGIFRSLYSEGWRRTKSRYFHAMYRRTSFPELQRITGCSKHEIASALSTLARIKFIERTNRVEPTKTGWRTEVRIKPIPESVIAAHKDFKALKKPRRSPRAPKKGYKRVNTAPDSESVLINKMLALALSSVRWYHAINPLHEFLKFGGDPVPTDCRRQRLGAGFSKVLRMLATEMFAVRNDLQWLKDPDQFDNRGYRRTSLKELKALSRCSAKELRAALQILKGTDYYDQTTLDAAGNRGKDLWVFFDFSAFLHALKQINDIQPAALCLVTVDPDAEDASRESHPNVSVGTGFDVKTIGALIPRLLYKKENSPFEEDQLPGERQSLLRKKDSDCGRFVPFLDKQRLPGHLITFSHLTRTPGFEWLQRLSLPRCPSTLESPVLDLGTEESRTKVCLLVPAEVAFIAARLKYEIPGSHNPASLTVGDIGKIHKLLMKGFLTPEKLERYLQLRDADPEDILEEKWMHEAPVAIVLSAWRTIWNAINGRTKDPRALNGNHYMRELAALEENVSRDLRVATVNPLILPMHQERPLLAAILSEGQLSDLEKRELKEFLIQNPRYLMKFPRFPLADWAGFTPEQLAQARTRAYEEFETAARFCDERFLVEEAEERGEATVKEIAHFPTTLRAPSHTAHGSFADHQTIGIPGLDRFLNGVTAASLTGFAAVTGTGKSAFSCQLAAANAMLGRTVCLLSPELSAQDAFVRIISNTESLPVGDEKKILQVAPPSFLTQILSVPNPTEVQLDNLEPADLYIFDGIEHWIPRRGDWLDYERLFKRLRSFSVNRRAKVVYTCQLSLRNAVGKKRIQQSMVLNCKEMVDWSDNFLAVSALPDESGARAWNREQFLSVLKSARGASREDIPIISEMDYQRFHFHINHQPL